MGKTKELWQKQMDGNFHYIATQNVCAQCFDDYAIAKFIENNAEEKKCDYCGKKSRKVISVNVNNVIEFMSEGIHREYEDAANSVAYCSREGGYQLSTMDSNDLISELEIVKDDAGKLFNDLVNAFSDGAWVHKDPYGNLPQDELRYTWEEFCWQIKHKIRFMFFKTATRSEWENNPEPYTILEKVTEAADRLGLIRKIPKGFTIIRARQHPSSKCVNSVQEIGIPPEEKATQNRMSPAGIPMFYGATNEETAFHEIFEETNLQKDVVTFGTFATLKELVIFDLSKDIEYISLFDEDRSDIRYYSLFMRNFRKDISKPIERDGKEHIEYVPTQVVSEYLRHIYKCPDGAHIDGIRFKSSKCPGNCITLFCDQIGCTDDTTACNKMVALVSYQANKIDFTKKSYSPL